MSKSSGTQSASSRYSWGIDIDETPNAELIAQTCYACEVCGEKSWPVQESHVCTDGLRVNHNTHPATEILARHYADDDGANGILSEPVDPDALVVTAGDLYRGSYHCAADGTADTDADEARPACLPASDPDKWVSCTQQRAWEVGRVPCSDCFDTPARDQLREDIDDIREEMKAKLREAHR